MFFFPSSNFRESTDGRSMVATFEMPPEVGKQDIHLSFQRNRLVVTWETIEVSEWEEDGVVMRERLERMFHRTLPLPEGTRVSRFQHTPFNVNLSLSVWRNSGYDGWSTAHSKIPQYAMLSSRVTVQVRRLLKKGLCLLFIRISSFFCKLGLKMPLLNFFDGCAHSLMM